VEEQGLDREIDKIRFRVLDGEGVTKQILAIA
jgi:hypothetical protein